MGSEPLVSALLEQLARGTPLRTSTYVLIAIVSLLAGAVGSWLASYLKVKGANLATRADFETLLDQLVRQTEVTEGIRADLLNRTWLGQRQWDLKRDLYRELLLAIERCLLNVTNAVNDEEIAAGAERHQIGDENNWEGIRDRAQRSFANYLEGVGEIHRVKATAQIFLTDKSRSALEQFFVIVPVSASGAEGLTLALIKSQKDRITDLRATIIESARADLEMPPINA